MKRKYIENSIKTIDEQYEILYHMDDYNSIEQLLKSNTFPPSSILADVIINNNSKFVDLLKQLKIQYIDFPLYLILDKERYDLLQFIDFTKLRIKNILYCLKIARKHKYNFVELLVTHNLITVDILINLTQNELLYVILSVTNIKDMINAIDNNNIMYYICNLFSVYLNKIINEQQLKHSIF